MKLMQIIRNELNKLPDLKEKIIPEEPKLINYEVKPKKTPNQDYVDISREYSNGESHRTRIILLAD